LNQVANDTGCSGRSYRLWEPCCKYREPWKSIQACC
jgi:hypothetical protein